MHRARIGIGGCLRAHQGRNDLAHKNRGYDAHDLHDVVQVLERTVRARALRLLWVCPVAVLERVCDVER